jgi:hypothetical protein
MPYKYEKRILVTPDNALPNCDYPDRRLPLLAAEPTLVSTNPSGVAPELLQQ